MITCKVRRLLAGMLAVGLGMASSSCAPVSRVPPPSPKEDILKPEAFHFADDNGGISLPPGFRAVVVADNVCRTRQIAVRENGDIYVSLRYPVDRNFVVAMRDTDGDGRMLLVLMHRSLVSM